MYFCCEEHVELALDSVVDEEEVAPTLEKLENKHHLSTNCFYCNEQAMYKVSG
ncbi:MAG: CxxH/CxxC protein [Bacillaceae bacterium]|nr:CxxH/CxxC protein [Bacillaceae bacterium]